MHLFHPRSCLSAARNSTVVFLPVEICAEGQSSPGKLRPISIGADDAGGGPAVGLGRRERYPESSNGKFRFVLSFPLLPLYPFSLFGFFHARTRGGHNHTSWHTESSVHGQGIGPFVFVSVLVSCLGRGMTQHKAFCLSPQLVQQPILISTKGFFNLWWRSGLGSRVLPAWHIDSSERNGI